MVNKRYLIINDITCSDSKIMGELVNIPKVGDELIFTRSSDNVTQNTHQKIVQIIPSVTNSADLVLILEDDSRAYIIVT